ncbi:MAG: PEP-CTERM sorting domain-containing protein [Verrucomicrobiales bacterium]|nr:PEP-CTERM sorting domain-containing protein [Verrucomicrobiales bacterium]
MQESIIPINALSTGPNYTLYGGDISGFAGQTTQMTFSDVGIFANFWNIDNIQFSSSPIPEPSMLALCILGALLLGFRRWQQSSQ